MPKYTYQEAEERLLEAIRWFEGLGISTKRTRLHRYLKAIKPSESTEEYRFDNIFNTLLEINEICDIHEGLRNLKLGDAYVEKLRKFCYGPEEYYEKETRKNHQSRDYGFELAIASQFAKHGFQVETTFNDVDVSTIHNGQKWLIECKRPRYDHSIRGNTKAAFAQLKKRLAHTEVSSYGVAAIALTRAITDELLVLGNASNLEARKITMETLNQIVGIYGKELKGLNNRPAEVVGLIFRLILPYWDTKNREIGTYTGHAVISFNHDGSKEINAFRELTKAISDEPLEVYTYR